MFCRSCGTEIKSGIKFCPNCGNGVTNQVTVQKKRDIASIPANEYAILIRPILEPLMQVERIQTEMTTKTKQYDKRIQSLKAGKIWKSLLIGYITAFLFRFINVFIVYKIALMDIVFYLILFPIAAFFYMYFLVEEKKKMPNIVEEKEDMIAYFTASINNSVSGIYDRLVTYVPQKYWYYDAIAHFYDYFINGRALNRQEAINLYEEEIHRARMESMQAEILRANKQQAAMAAISAVANVTTAANVSSINSKLS